jgi:hypothetical protein
MYFRGIFMQKIVLILIFQFFPSLPFSHPQSGAAQPSGSSAESLYHESGLAGKVDYAVFEQALAGYDRIGARRKKEVLTLIDFSKPSTDKRLFVIDMRARKILFETHVAHGRNSGGNYATAFSNRSGSHQSSLGFYLTDRTYIGRSGYSLVLDGLEPGINDNARSRAVVIHGAAYAEPSVAAAQGRLGRSWGCPALPMSVHKAVIDTIREGSVLFIYAADRDYVARSTLLSSADPVS